NYYCGSYRSGSTYIF
nr:immunoglobulin light chain junction region [Macaca mulatta]